MNPEWRTPEPDEVVECRINLLTGEVTQKTMAEVMDDYRADFLVPRFWDQKELKKLNHALGFPEVESVIPRRFILKEGKYVQA